MKKVFFPLVLSLLLLLTLCLAPVATYAAYTDDPINEFLNTYAGIGQLYGPPLPQDIQVLASRAGDLRANLNQTPEHLTYKVKAGDSLSAIAHVFDTNVTTLAQINNINNTNILHIGQELQVPSIATTISQNYQITQVISANLTAYTAGPESTGKHPGDPGYGITATGNHVRDQYTIAVDPSVIPLGSKVYIEGVGVRVADDTGGAIRGNRIDVYMSNLDSAIQFGYKKNIKVYLLQDKQPSDTTSNA